MSQTAAVIAQSANTSKALPRSPGSGQGHTASVSSSDFARQLMHAEQASAKETALQSIFVPSDSARSGQNPFVSIREQQTEQEAQALINLFLDSSPDQKVLQEAVQGGEFSDSFVAKFLADLQQTTAGDAQGGGLQDAAISAGQGQKDGPDLQGGNLSLSNALSALLSQSELSAQNTLAERSSTDMSQSQVKALFAKMTQLSEGSPSQGLGQGQNGNQIVDREMSSELRQVLQNLQILLGRAEGSTEGNRHQTVHADTRTGFGEAQLRNAMSDIRASQAVAPPQPTAPQPNLARGMAYYLQSYQGEGQVQPEASAGPDSMSLAAASKSGGEGKDLMFGQGRNSLAEAMLLSTGSGDKGKTGSGSGSQFGLTLNNTLESGTGNGSNTLAASGTSPGSSGVLTPGSQSTAVQAFGTQQAFDQSMVDQVKFKLSQGLRSGQQEVVVRMHPRELGEVRLSLTSDDGNLRAHLHVQSQQVQDVLERNMPRLRDALAEQGIDLDDFVFSSDDQRRGREWHDFEQENWIEQRQDSEDTVWSQDWNNQARSSAENIQYGLSFRI